MLLVVVILRDHSPVYEGRSRLISLEVSELQITIMHLVVLTFSYGGA